jgi:DNA-binding winged helix-turn-helix (wHTH) protein/TolB-like protein
MANYEFGPFRYDPEQRLLFREGQPVALAPKAIDTLHILLEHRGRIVEKGTLMKALWPDTTVDEVGLARNISILRKTLEEQAGGASYIETVPRRGYRFGAAMAETPAGPDVREAPVVRDVPDARDMPAHRRWPRWALLAATLAACAGLVYWQFYVPSRYVARGTGIAGLAVVPFEALTPDPERSGVARQITDLLVTDLSKLDRVQVVAPSTVRRHQRFGVSMGLMGRLLGLDVLVEGGVQTSVGHLIVTSRLVDVHTGKVIWAENYDRPLAEAGTAQDEVAREIAAQIGARLAGAKK